MVDKDTHIAHNDSDSLSLWRTLSPEEEKEFRQWAHDNFDPDGEANCMWHPVVRDEWEKLSNRNTLDDAIDSLIKKEETSSE